MEFSFSMNINLKAAPIIVPLFQDSTFSKSLPKMAEPNSALDIAEFKALENFLRNREEHKDFLAQEGEMLYTILDAKDLPTNIVLWGLGEKKKLTSQKLRGLAAQLIKSVRTLKKGEATLLVPDALILFAQTLGEGLTFGNYHLGKFKTGKE